MYVHLNCFDYDTLITGIIETFDLQDTDVNSETIGRIFTELSNRFGGDISEHMQDFEIKMCEDFLKYFTTFSNFELGDDADGYKEMLGENLQEAYISLQNYLEEPDESSIFDRFAELHLRNNADFNLFEESDEGENLAAFMEYFEELVALYITVTGRTQLTTGDIFILGQIEKYTKELEIVTDILVLDQPGKIVKYRDTLITFPLILIEVTEQ